LTQIIKCPTCYLLVEDETYWKTHQTMQDGHIWCVKGKTTRVDEMTRAIVNRYKAEVKAKYGNKKRHRV
jgi:hypothetical protein